MLLNALNTPDSSRFLNLKRNNIILSGSKLESRKIKNQQNYYKWIENFFQSLNEKNKYMFSHNFAFKTLSVGSLNFCEIMFN